MTTTVFANLLLADTRHRNLTAVPAEDAAHLLASINAAVQRYYDVAPDRYKRTTATLELAAPTPVTGLAIAPSTTQTALNAFEADWRGQAIRIDGDPGWNEIVDRSTVLYPYQGSSTGQAGTVYFDTWAMFDRGIERTVSQVYATNNGMERMLRRLTSAEVDNLFGYDGHSRGNYGLFRRTSPYIRRTAAEPVSYGVHSVGMSRQTGENDAVFMLRVDPIPTTRTVLRVQMNLLPRAYTMDDLDVPQELPVPDERIYVQLLPLARQAMSATPVWTSQVDLNRLDQLVAQALDSIRSMPGHFAPPMNRFGTPRGY